MAFWFTALSLGRYMGCPRPSEAAPSREASLPLGRTISRPSTGSIWWGAAFLSAGRTREL